MRTNASAALAANIFHSGKYAVADVTEYLRGGGACPAVVVVVVVVMQAR